MDAAAPAASPRSSCRAPGCSGIFAGLALLSQQYDWAERRVEPVRLRALKALRRASRPGRGSSPPASARWSLAACGVLWIMKPPAPGWWPLSETWWLPGGIWTGVTQVASAFIALGADRLQLPPLPRQPRRGRGARREIEERGRAARRRRGPLIAGPAAPWDIVPASRAIGAVVARFVHTEEVTGSNPVSPTRTRRGPDQRRRWSGPSSSGAASRRRRRRSTPAAPGTRAAPRARPAGTASPGRRPRRLRGTRRRGRVRSARSR